MTDMDLRFKLLAQDALDRAWAGDNPEWPGDAMAILFDFLQKTDRLLPPGAVKRVERGNRRAGGKICKVGGAFPGRFTREVFTWPVEGEPNDNWPIFYGPWKEIQT